MKKSAGRIKKYIKKSKQAFLTSYTVWNYHHGRIQDQLIAINSKYGKDLAGNMLRIMEAISSSKYGRYQMVLLARPEALARIKGFLKMYQIQNVRLVHTETAFTGWAERAKYIFTDVAMPFRFIKRDGQILVNTWHGTPLKTMGRYIKAERHSMGNLQRGFFEADYLVYPNRFMEKVMLRDYMVQDILCGQVMHEGYPRNTVFFDQKRRAELRRLLGTEEKQVFVYMPTHRGDMWHLKNEKQLFQVQDMLAKIDNHLTGQSVMYVKMHLFNGKPIDFSSYKHVLPFPDGYEVYDVLNTADCLITDYSSVLFDFANTGRKIILFAYDEKEYIEDRGGLYLSLDALPFPKVRTTDELLCCMDRPKEYDDTAFRKEYCTYDKLEATDRLLRKVLLAEDCTECVKVGSGKSNVVIFAGSLALNGITTACTNLLKALAKEKDRNYFAAFFRTQMNAMPEKLDAIPENIPYLSLYSDLYKTFWETVLYFLFIKKGKCRYIPQTIHRMYQREWKRYFGHVPFESVVDFDGYQRDASLLFAHAPCNRTIFVHSDMERENAARNIQQLAKLQYLYHTYDHVAVVDDTLIGPTERISGKSDNIVVINNQFDAEYILKMAEQPIFFDKETSYYISNVAGIEGVLASKGPKFITIGRYSAEKNHQVLINAFDRFCDSHPDSELIIIGGHGNLWNQTIRLVKSKRHRNHISLIRFMSNPYPILKRCNLFILPSLYEGFGLTLLEAYVLRIPILSTDVAGVHFFKENSILVKETTIEGMLDGMEKFQASRVPEAKIDLETMNKLSIQKFKQILKTNRKVKCHA